MGTALFTGWDDLSQKYVPKRNNNWHADESVFFCSAARRRLEESLDFPFLSQFVTSFGVNWQHLAEDAVKLPFGHQDRHILVKL